MMMFPPALTFPADSLICAIAGEAYLRARNVLRAIQDAGVS